MRPFPCAAALIDALVRVGVRCPTMAALLLRKTATLAVAYAIALQVLLAGFAVGVHAGFNSFAVICASNSTDDPVAPPKQQYRGSPPCSHGHAQSLPPG